MDFNYDVVIIGGGPAGLASALSAKEQGSSVLILERNDVLGGILNQCIHNGFGLHYFKEELTGPEYANRFVKLVGSKEIDVMLGTMVIGISKEKKITAINPNNGQFTIKAKSIVLTMGCRERPAGAIELAGTRPSGVYTAGCAQRLVNMDGYLVGKKVAILGSGDIGLIMARRMTFEGAKVVGVFELMPFSSGLKRNIVQCLDDYNIPLHYSTTITRLCGRNRLDGVFVAPVDAKLKPILSQETFIECDTLLLSVGLLPETDLIANLDIEMDRVTTGAVVNDYRETSMPGVFAAGNVLHVHDLVDNVSEEAEIAGKYASLSAKGQLPHLTTYRVFAENGIRYALPQKITEGSGKIKIYFRVGAVFQNAKVQVFAEDNIIASKKYAVLAPGEMENITIDRALINKDIVLKLEDTNNG